MNPLRLIYIANARMPTEKAHGIQIMKMCEAFARAGIEVELVIPWRFNKIKENPFDYYGVEKIFRIIKVPSIDLVKFGKIGFLAQSFSFAKLVCLYAMFKKADIIYSRDILPLFFLSFFKKNLFWETHRGEFNFTAQRLLKKCRGIIAITEGLKNFYIEKGAAPNKILVAPDGVDLKEFDIPVSKETARKKLNLPQDKKIILYTGHLYGWKGADILAGASAYLSENTEIYFVGGTENDISKFKIQNSKLKNITVIGYRPHQEIPYWLKAADVLVLPNSAKEDISKFYTSPLKLFEYMASKRPIVASDLPSLREVLNENNSILVPSENSGALAEGIKKVLQNQDLAKRISEQAYRDVQGHTWQKRTQRILDFVNFPE